MTSEGISLRQTIPVKLIMNPPDVSEDREIYLNFLETGRSLWNDIIKVSLLTVEMVSTIRKGLRILIKIRKTIRNVFLS